MPRGLSLDIQAIGAEKAEAGLEGVARRLVNLIPAWRRVETELELGHRRHFDRLRGRYVRTGDLRASLTEAHANGSIREHHDDELIFGTSIFYAKFQRKGKKSAVVVLQPLVRRRASQIILEHVVEGR